jgi:hypothetical protein
MIIPPSKIAIKIKKNIPFFKLTKKGAIKIKYKDVVKNADRSPDKNIKI